MRANRRRSSLGLEIGGDATVREHRPLAVLIRERDDDPVPRCLDGPRELDSDACQLLGGEPPGVVRSALPEPAGRTSERRDPGRDVRTLAPGRQRHGGRRVGAACELLVMLARRRRGRDRRADTTLMAYDRRMARDDEPHDPTRRGRFRTFVLGGLVGASAVAAALRRARRRRARPVQAGLGAFESAPCYRELLERERREGP